MKNLIALICGTMFGAGLALSGMTDTAKVLGFLDIFGSWDPSLAFVMGSALTVTIIGFKLVFRRPKPLLDANFHLPAAKHIDINLIGGAILFGIGWGLYGLCPGPAIASIYYAELESATFLLSMVCGTYLADRLA